MLNASPTSTAVAAASASCRVSIARSPVRQASDISRISSASRLLSRAEATNDGNTASAPAAATPAQTPNRGATIEYMTPTPRARRRAPPAPAGSAGGSRRSPRSTRLQPQPERRLVDRDQPARVRGRRRRSCAASRASTGRRPSSTGWPSRSGRAGSTRAPPRRRARRRARGGAGGVCGIAASPARPYSPRRRDGPVAPRPARLHCRAWSPSGSRSPARRLGACCATCCCAAAARSLLLAAGVAILAVAVAVGKPLWFAVAGAELLGWVGLIALMPRASMRDRAERAHAELLRGRASPPPTRTARSASSGATGARWTRIGDLYLLRGARGVVHLRSPARLRLARRRGRVPRPARGHLPGTRRPRRARAERGAAATGYRSNA